MYEIWSVGHKPFENVSNIKVHDLYLYQFITPHVHPEQGKVIGVGVHIYMCVFIYLGTKKI